jgi:hypothetical protein
VEQQLQHQQLEEALVTERQTVEQQGLKLITLQGQYVESMRRKDEALASLKVHVCVCVCVCVYVNTQLHPHTPTLQASGGIMERLEQAARDRSVTL